jgi:hypothetical protein
MGGSRRRCRVALPRACVVALSLAIATAAHALTQDITSHFAITISGLVLNRTTNTFDSTVTLRNTSAPLLAPIAAVVGSLPAAVTLANKTGETPDGKPYVSPLSPGSILPSGATLSFVLKYANPERVAFTSVLQILYALEVPPNAASPIFAASPNPILVNAGESHGVTTINWDASDVSLVEVRVNSPTGPLFAMGESKGSAQTGRWVSNAMEFFLVDRATGETLSATAVTVATRPSTLIAFRPILDPYDVTDATGMFQIDHLNKPLDLFYLQARYQRPDPANPNSSPVAYQTNYQAYWNTGLGPLPPAFQRGNLGGSQAQSVFQLHGTEVGILMRSWDSPHPSLLPACQPNCSGYQKHTVYEQRFSNAKAIFSQNGTDRALEIEADFRVHQFESWNIHTGGAPLGLLAGQYAVVLFLEDPYGKKIQYVIFVYDSLLTNDGDELLMLETIGAGHNGLFVNTSFKKNRPMRYSTVDPESADFSHHRWNGYRNFKVQLTYVNILRAIQDLNSLGGSLSTDVYEYKISQIGINQEIYYENNGDAWTMGSSMRNLTVREVYPAGPIVSVPVEATLPR